MLLKSTRSGARLVLLAALALVISISPGLADTFFEGFEDGTLGAMEPMNIDADLHSLEASDGYRCQYSDPDWVNSNSYGQITDCYLGATEEHAEDFFWSVVDGFGDGEEARSYSGRFAVWMGALIGSDEHPGNKPPSGPNGPGSGKPEDPVGGLTAPIATLEALVTAEPIFLSNDGDGPELTFKHQISLPDYRCVNTTGATRSTGGGVVQVQIVSPGGAALSDWRTLTPYANTYDQQLEDNYTNCFFDPTDDGNTEDDFYDPDDPERRLGPSSLCYDQSVFARMGETSEPYDPSNLGYADGPGLEGENGLGTWVESSIDLSDYGDKHILIRFVTNGIKVGSYETYDDVFMWNPISCDDGWFIDDITVTGVGDAPEDLSADQATRTAPAGGLKTLQARPTP